MNRLAILLAHLLKWQYPYPLPELGGGAYQRAILVAARETDKDEDTFPATFEQTGWSWEQASIGHGVFP